MADENQNEEQEPTFQADVADFVEKLLQRQDKFEADAKKKQDDFEIEIRGKVADIQAKVDEVDALVKGALADATATIKTLLPGRRLPSAGSASKN